MGRRCAKRRAPPGPPALERASERERGGGEGEGEREREGERDIGESPPWEMSGYLGRWLEMVGDERISMDMFRYSGDPLETSPTKDIQPRYPKIS